MTPEEIKELVDKAKDVRKNAYSPYYKVHVGAALLDEEGKVYVGCNIENAAGPAISCAEANALGAAIAQGSQKFKAIAIVGAEDHRLFPCGLCRQKLAEFSPALDIYLADMGGTTEHHTLDQLLPSPPKL